MPGASADRLERAGGAQQALELARQVLVRGAQRAAMRDDEQPVAGWGDARPAPPHDLAQAPPRAVALHRAAHALAAGDEADAARLAGPGEGQQGAPLAAIGTTIGLGARNLQRGAQPVVARQSLAAL